MRRRCGIARQFFRAAVRKRLIPENPFAEMEGVSVRANRARDFFLTRQDAARVLDACPDAEWRLIFALSRYGGLRCPSETLALRWSDIDWANNRFTVTSRKTEHHEGHGSRVVPLFPELRPYFEDAFDPEAVYVITRYQDGNSNLRTQLNRIIKRAGLTPWEKLFQNLRASRATELAAQFPSHVAAEWLGHSTMVAQKHYWRTTEDDFEKAAGGSPEALHKAVQQPAARGCNEDRNVAAFAGICDSPGVFGGNQLARKDSNLK